MCVMYTYIEYICIYNMYICIYFFLKRGLGLSLDFQTCHDPQKRPWK
jgi:hypothetical protein